MCAVAVLLSCSTNTGPGQGIQDEDRAWSFHHGPLLIQDSFLPVASTFPPCDSAFLKNYEVKAPLGEAALALPYALPSQMETMPESPRPRGRPGLPERLQGDQAMDNLSQEVPFEAHPRD